MTQACSHHGNSTSASCTFDTLYGFAFLILTAASSNHINKGEINNILKCIVYIEWPLKNGHEDVNA